MPKVAIVILNWNGKEDALECLDSVFRIDYPNFEIIVVDNGSTDGSVAAIREAHPQAELIETGENLGYAGGNNVGIQRALENGADYVFILNNDTVVAPDLLTHLVATAQRFPQAGILGPKIYYHAQPDVIWSAGGYWDEAQQCFEQTGDGEKDQGQFNQAEPTDFLVGCALFVRAECFRKVGLLDESFFLNYEEIDFEYRAKQHGFQLVYVPKARLWHKVAASFDGEQSPLKSYFTYRNRLLWASRHLPRRQRLQLTLSVYRIFLTHLTTPAISALGKKSLRESWWTLSGAFSSPITRAIGRAILDFHRHKFGNCPAEIHALQARWKELQQETTFTPPASPDTGQTDIDR